MPWERVVYSRNKLYEEIWAEPATKVAKKYGVSDVAIRKMCKKLNVPLPPLGYWAKLQFGKDVKRPPLPAADGPEQIVVEKWREPEIPIRSEHQQELQNRIAFEKAPGNRITVAQSLSAPHALISSTIQVLREAERNDNDILILNQTGCLDVHVSRGSVDRSLRILDSLIKALDQRGFLLTITKDSPPKTQVSVFGETIQIELRELLERHERELTEQQKKDKLKNPWKYPRPEYDCIPSGKLALQINSYGTHGIRTSWTDGANQKVEECLNSFMTTIINIASKFRAERLERLRQQMDREEQERLRKEKEKREREEQEKIQKLERDVDAWYKAQRIRNYVQAVREEFIQRGGSISNGCEFEQWLNWAIQHANNIDPMMNGRPAKGQSA